MRLGIHEEEFQDDRLVLFSVTVTLSLEHRFELVLKMRGVSKTCSCCPCSARLRYPAWLSMSVAPPENQTLHVAMASVTVTKRISPLAPREPPVAHPGRNDEELRGPVRLRTDGKDTNWMSMGGRSWKGLASKSAAPKWRPAK